VIYDPLETILLRDRDGYLVEYEDNRETRGMRKRLDLLNEALLTQKVAVAGRVIREGDALDLGGRARTQMHRVFSRGSFDLGGRFYGGHWQNLPQERRASITINGQPTVEIDYAALHIRLLYQEAGKPMIGDPYEIDGWPRKQVKVAMLIGINAKTEKGTIRAIAENVTAGRFDTAKDLLAAIKAKHPDIARAFGSDAGVRLMRKDSVLADAVLHQMLHETGLVPLCVHDSFIVPDDQKGRLEAAMERQIAVKNTSVFATSQTVEKS
jgi:hypothetical protein